MRWLLPWSALLLGGCHERRSFDEQYRQTADEISGRATRIDANLTAEQNGSSAAGHGEEPPTAQP